MYVSCEALQMDHASLLKQFEHLDPHNQNTFEAKDLELLISTVRPWFNPDTRISAVDFMYVD